MSFVVPYLNTFSVVVSRVLFSACAFFPVLYPSNTCFRRPVVCDARGSAQIRGKARANQGEVPRVLAKDVGEVLR